MFPGPLITAQKGDDFAVEVVNELRDDSMFKSTSVHWHGLFQNGMNYTDGTSFVTQCPIAQNHSFLHSFSAPNQAGTYWYHSRYSCDGLRGGPVIYDPEDPLAHMYDVDDASTVITLSDWYHVVAPILRHIIGTTANSSLINGLGRYAGGPASELAVINVEQGKRYRMRLVAMSCDPSFYFSVDGHNLTVIEADGLPTEPLVVDELQIFAGQRYFLCCSKFSAELKSCLIILEANKVVELTMSTVGPGGPGAVRIFLSFNAYVSDIHCTSIPYIFME
ncbi:Cupredoxin [Suillus cothurnatus]|nr:Cupredoxin [Suillus cothurnatus]